MAGRDARSCDLRPKAPTAVQHISQRRTEVQPPRHTGYHASSECIASVLSRSCVQQYEVREALSQAVSASPLRRPRLAALRKSDERMVGQLSNFDSRMLAACLDLLQVARPSTNFVKLSEVSAGAAGLAALWHTQQNTIPLTISLAIVRSCPSESSQSGLVSNSPFDPSRSPTRHCLASAACKTGSASAMTP